MNEATNNAFVPEAFMDLMAGPTDRFSVNLEKSTMLEVIDEYIKHRSVTHPRFEEQWFTTKKYLRGLEFLCQQTIMPDRVSELFYPHLIRYMLQQGCATSTVERTCSQLRSSLEWGSRYGAPISPSYDKFDFIGKTRKQTILSYAELCHLYYFDIGTLPKHRKDWYERMERTRDMFIFSVLLGQRHSDAVRVDKTFFTDDTFEITQQKTGNRVSFKWLDYAFDQKIARELFTKYDFTCPYPVSVSVYDRSLHELFKAIGQEFNTEVKSEEKILGVITTRLTPRWKLIGSHTARRTAVSFWSNQGMHVNKLRKFSGHSDIRSLQDYMLDED